MDSIFGWCEKDRKLKTKGFAKTLGAKYSLNALVEKLKEDVICQKLLTESELCEIIEAFLKWRLLGLVVPEKVYDLSINGVEVNNLIRSHFNDLGISENHNLFRETVLISSNIRQKLQGARKRGIESFRDFKNKEKLKCILNGQNMRCFYCGKKFEQIEGQDVQLDHLIPFHIGDDTEGNWAISCQICNRGKRDSLHYSLEQLKHDGVRSSIEDNGFECLRWAALNKYQNCGSCNKGPRDSHLNIVKLYQLGLWTLANCGCRCDSCLKDSDVLLT
jgi:hypothetical protein